MSTPELEEALLNTIGKRPEISKYLENSNIAKFFPFSYFENTIVDNLVYAIIFKVYNHYYRVIFQSV